MSRLLRPSTLLGLGLLCLSLFSLINGSYALMVRWPWVLLWQGGWASIALATFFYGRSPRHGFQCLGFGGDWAVGITALVVLLSSALAVQVPPTLSYLVNLSGYGLALYGVVNWLSDRPDSPRTSAPVPLPLGISVGLKVYRLPAQSSSDRRWHLIQAMGLVGLGSTIVGWGAWAMAQARLAEPINPFPLGDPDFVAGYLLLLLPLWGLLSWGSQGWGRSAWAAVVGLGAGLLYTTGSGVGAVGLGGLVLALTVGGLSLGRGSGHGDDRADLSPSPSKGRSLPSGFLPPWGWGFVALAVWAVALVNHPRWPGWNQWQTLQRDPWNLATGVNVMGAYPWWGIGLGNTAKVFDAYRPGVATVSSFRDVGFSSTPLQLGVELGVLGLGLYLGWIIFVAVLWGRVEVGLDQALGLALESAGSQTLSSPALEPGLQRAVIRRDRLISRGCGASLLAYGCGSLLDFQLENIPIALTLVLLLAVLLSVGQTYGGAISVAPFPLQQRLQALPLVLLALWIGLWIPTDGAMALARSGMGALERGDLAGFYDRWAAAADRVPWDPYYDFQIGAQLSQGVERLNAQGLPQDLPGEASAVDQARQFREDLLRKARRHLQYAVQSSPADDLFNRYLGFFLADVDPAAAIAPLVRSAQLSPRHPYTHGLMAMAQGYLLPPPPAAEADPDANPDSAPDETPDPASAPASTPENPTLNPDPAVTAQQSAIIQALALEGFVNPLFLFNDPAQLPDLQDLWTPGLGAAVQLYDRALGQLLATSPDYGAILQNRILLGWWFAQQTQQPYNWSALRPEDLAGLNPRVQAIAALDQNQPAAALDRLQGDPSPAAALLRAWIAPERFLPALFGDQPLPPALASRLETLAQTIADQRSFAPWLLGLQGETRLSSQGIGFLFYRNTNGPDAVQLPATFPVNVLVQNLSLLAEVGESAACDRVLQEAQQQLWQTWQTVGNQPQND